MVSTGGEINRENLRQVDLFLVLRLWCHDDCCENEGVWSVSVGEEDVRGTARKKEGGWMGYLWEKLMRNLVPLHQRQV